MGVEQVRDAYASVADLYIKLFGTTGDVHPDDLAFIERHLSKRVGRVLDLGCGPGHLTDFLRSLGVDATGVDIVPGFIEHARATHPDGDYRLGSLTDLGVPDRSIAGILAYYSLIHLPPPDLDAVLAGFRRVLAPGGALVVGFVDRADDGDEPAAFDHKVTTAYRWSVAEFSERLARAGFTAVEHLRRPGDDTQRPQATIAAVVQA